MLDDQKKKVNDIGIIFVFIFTGRIINHHNYKVGIVLNLQMGKLRPRKFKKFVECYKTTSTPNVVPLHYVSVF